MMGSPGKVVFYHLQAFCQFSRIEQTPQEVIRPVVEFRTWAHPFRLDGPS
jgi:hypothetical protein